MDSIPRRSFLKTAGALAVGAALSCRAKEPAAPAAKTGLVPAYLRDYADLYAKDPRAAALRWFREARFGLFIHYGLFSLSEHGEWLQFRGKIHVAEYAKFKDRFTAAKFDADAVTDLACEAGMKYVNLVSRHCDSFSLFETGQNDFHSLNSPAKRDFVGEMAGACRKRNLGFCLYYTHGRDWRHPHAPNNDRWGSSARPAYDPPEPFYAYGRDHDLNRYLDFMTAQVTELLTRYGPIAAIWLDGIGVPLNDRTKTPCPRPPRQKDNAPEFRAQELYDLVHRLQPQVLVSYKQGLLGTEDFFSPEHRALPEETGKPVEICTTLQKKTWGYDRDAPHLTIDEAMEKIEAARRARANLLLNAGPLGDGAIHPADAATLKEIGRRLRTG